MDLRKILMKIVPAEDKLIHAWYGVLISVVYLPLKMLGIDLLYGLIFAIVIAAANEIYQKVSKTGVADVGDFVFTVIPNLITYIIAIYE